MDVGRGRRTVVGALLGALAGGVLTVAFAGPAAAKGPQRVTITPPGGDPVAISNVMPPDESDEPDGEPGPLFDGQQEPIETDPRFARLIEALGIWEVTGAGGALLPEAPTENLGPALAVEWTMYNPRPGDPDAAPGVVQSLYPVAEGGPLVHTEGGQRYFQQAETAAGWFRAPDDLVATLAAVGVEVEFRTPDVDPADGAVAVDGGAAASPADDERPWVVPLAAGTGVVLVMAGSTVAYRRRSRRRPRPAGGAGSPTASGTSTVPATSAANPAG